MGVVELRQYTLRPGGRDVLVELFDREFVESQEALGMEIVGQFRDLDRPDRFVWLRGFPDMVRRRKPWRPSTGTVWQAHGPAANATMLDSDDVLLLRPATPASGFAPLPPRHEAPPTLIVVTVCPGPARGGSGRRRAPAGARRDGLVAAGGLRRGTARTPSLRCRSGPVSMWWCGSSGPLPTPISAPHATLRPR